MRIIIDADGCPVVRQADAICREKGLEMIIVCDTSHVFNIEGVQIITVDKGADSADFRLVNLIKKDDIVITQDYGLAAMCLARNAVVINQNGMIYDNNNIDSLLLARHTAKKIRNSGGRLKGSTKRTAQQDIDFVDCLRKLVEDKVE